VGTPDFGPCSDAASHTPEAPLADGAHTFRVRATDTAGNQATATRDFEVDTNAPEAPELLTTDPLSPANDSSPLVEGNAPAGTTVRIYSGAGCAGAPIETATAAELEAGIEVTVAANATTELRATATTAAENTSACSAPLTYVEDSTAPDTAITGKPDSISDSDDARFEFSGDALGGSEVAAFQCRRDSSSEAAWQICASPKTYSSLPDGAHEFEVRAVDLAGNVDGSPASFKWAIDTSEPPDDSSSSSSTPPPPAPAPTPAPAQFVRIAYNTKAGTAQLFFSVPEPGLLTARAPEFKLPDAKSSSNKRRAALRKLRIRQRSIMPRTVRVTQAGQARVPIALSPVGRKLLRKSGKLKVRVVIGFRSSTGASAKVWRLPVTLKKKDALAAKRAQRAKQRRAKRARGRRGS